MDLFILTNNEWVRDRMGKDYQVDYRELSFREILVAARDLIHEGHRLLTHPLSGSVKPQETPYKSMALTKSKGALDLRSLELIENAIAACDKFIVKFPNMPDGMRDDFRLIDYCLISKAL